MVKNSSIAAPRKDIYQEVTDAVIRELENGCPIWRKGWTTFGAPRNAIGKNTYRGWNLFYLNFITQMKGYSAPYFLTYKQARENGGHIREGAHGYPVYYYPLIKRPADAEPAALPEGEEGEMVKFRVAKKFIVFNIDQCEGIDFKIEQPAELPESERLNTCEQVVTSMPKAPALLFDGSDPCYSISNDQIHMPRFSRFESAEEYYCTLFHELGHSTGHASRLNRKELTNSVGFGTELYSKEELTAEMTAAMLCGTCGITGIIPNTAAYIQSWITALNNDKTLLLRAASQAQKAADFILNLHSTSEEPVPATPGETFSA